jgi:hypothetical protein
VSDICKLQQLVFRCASQPFDPAYGVGPHGGQLWQEAGRCRPRAPEAAACNCRGFLHAYRVAIEECMSLL